MTLTRLALPVVLACTIGVPLSAQTRRPAPLPSDLPAISVRPFFLLAGEQFAAKTTFEAAFGESMQRLWGGGVQIADKGGFFLEVSASRFKKDGQRAFVNNGEIFRLGIPLTATLTPFEFSAGYRFGVGVRSRRVIPYAGGGIGRYAYQETSEFADTGDDVDTHHVGYLAFGGVEFRLHRWIGVAVDAHYTRVSGILGTGGVSKDAGEDDLGGIAARFKFIVGR